MQDLKERGFSRICTLPPDRLGGLQRLRCRELCSWLALLRKSIDWCCRLIYAPDTCNTAMDVNISIVSKPGDIFSLCFIDVARYLRYLLSCAHEAGSVRISKNRLYSGLVNIVLGAHMDPSHARYESFDCIFFNLEQLSDGGKAVNPEYLSLLRRSACIDYSLKNVSSYRDSSLIGSVPIVSFGYAPYLSESKSCLCVDSSLALSGKLIFMGSINAKRAGLIGKISLTGVDPVVMDPLFGPEKDEAIKDARALLNIPFYETSIFEQVRVFQVLSLGVPVISIDEGEVRRSAPSVFQESVFWVAPGQVDLFFGEFFQSSEFMDSSKRKLAKFSADRNSYAIESLNELISSFSSLKVRKSVCGGEIFPRRINLGSGKSYVPGYLNIDILERLHPDLCLDLGAPIEFPMVVESEVYGRIELAHDSFELIYADNVLEHVQDLPSLMTNCLNLLVEGGLFVAIVPLEGSKGAWQDPTHVRAMNENSWLYYTDWFWYLGWFACRFRVRSAAYFDASMRPVSGKDEASFMKIELAKVMTTLKERNRARLLAPDWGPLED